jgi:hypothetical protein
MEAGFMVLMFAAVVIAFTLGYLLGKASGYGGVQGTVHILMDERDKKAYPYLESNIPMEELATMNQAVFNIRTTHQDSHE